jgi:hypothetical protein
MPDSDAAELSSLASLLDDVTRRVTAMAERHAGAGNDEISSPLFDAERALRQAGRTLERVRGTLS